MNSFPPSKVSSEPSTAKFQIVKSNAYPFNDRIVAAHQMAFMNGNTNNGEEVSQKVNTSPTTLFTSTPQSLVPKPKEATFTSLLSASKKKWCYEDYEGDDNVRKYYCPKHKREYKDRDTFRRHLRTAQHGSEYKLEDIEKYRVATTKNVNSGSKKQKFDEECNKQCDADCADCESSDESDDDVNDEPDDDDGNETDDDYVDGNGSQQPTSAKLIAAPTTTAPVPPPQTARTSQIVDFTLTDRPTSSAVACPQPSVSQTYDISPPEQHPPSVDSRLQWSESHASQADVRQVPSKPQSAKVFDSAVSEKNVLEKIQRVVSATTQHHCDTWKLVGDGQWDRCERSTLTDVYNFTLCRTILKETTTEYEHAIANDFKPIENRKEFDTACKNSAELSSLLNAHEELVSVQKEMLANVQKLKTAKQKLDKLIGESYVEQSAKIVDPLSKKRKIF